MPSTKDISFSVAAYTVGDSYPVLFVPFTADMVCRSPRHQQAAAGHFPSRRVQPFTDSPAAPHIHQNHCQGSHNSAKPVVGPSPQQKYLSNPAGTCIQPQRHPRPLCGPPSTAPAQCWGPVLWRLPKQAAGRPDGICGVPPPDAELHCKHLAQHQYEPSAKSGGCGVTLCCP